MRSLPGKALALVHEAGFEVDLLPESLDGHGITLPEADVEAVLAAARRAHASCVLIDHYGASAEYLRCLADADLIVAVIDDMAERDLTAADWLLNQNLRASTLCYRRRPDCVKLLGPKYALLRPEFARARANLSRQFSSKDRHVLVTLGGGNTVELSSAIVEALEPVIRSLEVRCVVGRTGHLSTRLSKVIAVSRHEVQVLHDVTNMVDQMTWADLSINAGGSTCWELMCLGVPMMVMALSDDQRSNAKALEEVGCAKQIGAEHLHSLPFIVEDSLGEPRLRAAMSERGASLVDGNGAARAAESLMQLVRDRRGRRTDATY
jgi:spore coat polysaccharide biosynthesis predicted glycosyltransferase SpsG